MEKGYGIIMKITRLFDADGYRGTKNYIETQKKYVAVRTIIYFGISLSLFLAGFIATKTRINLLTIVAVLGCLPASKSAVEMIMFFKFRSCSPENISVIEKNMGELNGLYDMVFTSYDKNYNVSHMTVKGNTICGFSEDKNFDEQGFYKHLDNILTIDGFKDTSVKIFTDIKKYGERLRQLKELDANEAPTEGIIKTLKSVVL